jgi:hypothetical protein
MSVLRDLRVDLKDPGLIEALRQLAILEWTWNSIKAQSEQERVARELPEARCLDGIGQMCRQVHEFAYHDWAAKEGSYGVWTDRSFNRYMDRVAPETRVKAVRSKAGIGFEGRIHRPFHGEKRFVKRYPPNPNPTPSDPC